MILVMSFWVSVLKHVNPGLKIRILDTVISGLVSELISSPMVMVAPSPQYAAARLVSAQLQSQIESYHEVGVHLARDSISQGSNMGFVLAGLLIGTMVVVEEIQQIIRWN